MQPERNRKTQETHWNTLKLFKIENTQSGKHKKHTETILETRNWENSRKEKVETNPETHNWECKQKHLRKKNIRDTTK